MKCEFARIIDYYKKSLSREEAEDIEKHLQECYICRRDYDNLKKMDLKGEVSPENKFFNEVRNVLKENERRVPVMAKKGPNIALALSVIFLIIAGVAAYFILFSQPGVEKGEFDQSAFIISMAGDVKVAYGDSTIWKPVSIGEELIRTAKIKTGTDSFCDIQIGKQSTYRLKNGSELVLQEMLFNEKEGVEKTSLKLAIGKVLAKPKKILKASSFTIQTPTAVAGVRGTEFMVELDEAQNTKVAVAEGSVSFKPRVQKMEEMTEEEIASDENLNEIMDITEGIILEVDQEAEIKTETVEKINEVVEKVVDEEVEVNKEEIVKEIAEMKKDVSVEIKAQEVSEEIKEELKEIKAVKVIENITEKKIEITKLSIKSKPNQAEVYINGELQGKTMFQKIMQPGEYKILIKKEGFEDYTEKITLEEGDDKSISEKLTEIKKVPEKEVKKAAPVRAPQYGMKWQYKAGSRVTTAVRFGDNLIFASISDGTVHAVNKIGKKVWSFKASRGISSTPAVYKGKVYFGANDGNLYCISASSGKKIWTKQIGVINYAQPVFSQANLYIGVTTSIFYAMNVDSGAIIWSYKPTSGIYSSAAVSGDKVFMGSEDTHLYALNKADGSVLWKFKTGYRIVSSSPVVVGNKVTIGSSDGNLYAININSGQQVWKVSFGSGSKIFSSAASSGNSIYLGSSTGTFMAINANNGNKIWAKSLGAKIESTATVTGNKVIVGCNDGNVYILSRTSGKELWKFKTDGTKMSAKPLVIGKNVYLGSGNGTFYSLKLAE